MKQSYKRIVLTRAKVVNNILKIWSLSQPEDRFDWYLDAYNYAVRISQLHPNCSIDKACGIIAALSPRKRWSQNKVCAEALLVSGDCGQTGLLKNKAKTILSGINSEAEILETLHGKKISSFYLNIRYPDKAIAVTIDRHAISICLGRKASNRELITMSANQYQFFADCYRHAAARLNISPLLLQSATWVTWRKG